MELRCVQTIDRAGHYCQCSRRAVWYVTTSDTRGVCTQHRRYNDDRRVVR